MSWNEPGSTGDGNASGWGDPQPPPSQFPPPPPQYAPPQYPPSAGYVPPPPGAAPQGWSGQPYAPGVYATNPHEGRATTVLVLGILGLVFCGLLAPVAWVMGNGVKNDSEAAGFAEPGTNKAGRICGMIGSVLILLGIVVFVLLMVVGIIGSTSN